MTDLANQDRGTLSRADSASQGGVLSLGTKRLSWLALSCVIEVTQAAVDLDLWHRSAEDLAKHLFMTELMQQHREFTRVEAITTGGTLDADGKQLTLEFTLMATVPPNQTERDIEAFWRYCGPMETRRTRAFWTPGNFARVNGHTMSCTCSDCEEIVRRSVDEMTSHFGRFFEAGDRKVLIGDQGDEIAAGLS